MYFEYYLMGIILLPGIILAIRAQAKISAAYSKYSQVSSHQNLTAAEFVKKLLFACDMSDIAVKKINGELTDHYNPAQKEICLSENVHNSTSVAALGIACHEFGHALQKKEKYFPYQIRKIAIPISNIFLTSIVSILSIIKLEKMIEIDFFEILLPIFSSILMFFCVKIILFYFTGISGLIFAVILGVIIYFSASYPLTMNIFNNFIRKNKIKEKNI